MGKKQALWWSLFWLFAPALGDAEGGGGELCRAWVYGPLTFSSSSAGLGPFQCPEQLDGADAKFCCGTCHSPYCCSAEGDRLDQEGCGLAEATKGVEVATAVPDSPAAPGTETAQKGGTTPKEETTPQGELSTGTQKPLNTGKEVLNIFQVLLGPLVLLATLILCLHAKEIKWRECFSRLFPCRSQEQDSDSSAAPTVINMPLPPPPPYCLEDVNPPPYSEEDTFKPVAQPPASDSAAVEQVGCTNPSYQGSEEVVDMGPAIIEDGAAAAQPAEEEQAMPPPEPTMEGEFLTLPGPDSEEEASSLPESIGEGKPSLLLTATGGIAGCAVMQYFQIEEGDDEGFLDPIWEENEEEDEASTEM